MVEGRVMVNIFIVTKEVVVVNSIVDVCPLLGHIHVSSGGHNNSVHPT